MQIRAKAWSEYIARLSSLNRKAGQLVQAYLDSYGAADGEALIRYAYAVVTQYGEGSAELACQLYDAMSEAERVQVSAAEPAPTASYGEVARLVNATRQSPPQLQSGVSRLVKQAGADTTLHNALRDGAEFAWVPHGDTCPFCIMLASRGWQRASKKALKNGHAEHIHANCDCTYAIRFNSTTGVAGYDPTRYLAAYEGAEGTTPQEKLNAMRRAHYEANQGKITAQKRAAYRKRLEIEHTSAIIKPDRVISGHSSTPKQAEPNIVIDRLGINGKTGTRAFYGANGFKRKEITTHGHGNLTTHPYGENGEHAHDYTWTLDGRLENRTTRELTEEERKENADIL